MKKALFLITGIWFAVVCFAPIEPGTYVDTVNTHGVQFVIPPLLLIIACLYEFNPQWFIWKLLNTRLWSIIGIIALAYIAIAWIVSYVTGTSVPTFGSYNTVGVLLILFLLTTNTTHIRVGDTRAWLLGTAAVFFSIGLWESLYQICSWFSWYHTWFPWQALVYNELAVWRPHPLIVVPFIMLAVYYAKSQGFKFNWWTLLPTGVFIAIWVTWYATGYWILWYCDHYQSPPVWVYHTPINWVWYLAARGSKAVLAIAQVLLVSGIIGVARRGSRRWLLTTGIVGVVILMYVLARVIAGIQ